MYCWLMRGLIEKYSQTNFQPHHHPMNTLKTILVVVDFSTGSRSALEQAARLAGLNGAKLHVLHVVDTASIQSLADSRGERFERQAITTTEGASAALTRWLAQSGVPADCETTIAVGVPLHEILEHEQKEKPDLLVAGITGAHGALSGAGSVSTKLARNAKSKLLLVRADHASGFRKIVACIDFSDTAREVATQAHRVALQDGAVVNFLHVWLDPWLAMPFMMPVVAADTQLPETFMPNLHSSLKEFVSEAAQDIESAEILYESSNYANGIAAHATESQADLIVIGAKGHTNLRYVLLGSTAERLLTRLPCSMLIVKSEVE